MVTRCPNNNVNRTFLIFCYTVIDDFVSESRLLAQMLKWCCSISHVSCPLNPATVPLEYRLCYLVCVYSFRPWKGHNLKQIPAVIIAQLLQLQSFQLRRSLKYKPQSDEINSRALPRIPGSDTNLEKVISQNYSTYLINRTRDFITQRPRF